MYCCTFPSSPEKVAEFWLIFLSLKKNKRSLEIYVQQVFQTINAGLRYLEKYINEMSSMIIFRFLSRGSFQIPLQERKYQVQ